MGLLIEHGCPHCGAALQLDETDRIIDCPYCGIKSLLASSDYFRYVLPDKAGDKELIYVPYLRFKGVVYYCTNKALGHRIIDITHRGLDLKGIPDSLGVRPQAMKLRFVTPRLKGTFLRFSLKATDILMKAATLTSPKSGGEEGVLHRAFIGETMSIIYLPMYQERNRLFDGILNRPIATLDRGMEDLAPLTIEKHGDAPEFVSTLCPNCGWKMDGERDSVVLLCKNCNSAWEFIEEKWRRLDFSIGRGDTGPLYIPFWRITASVKGVEIDSFADFVRLTNQPMIVSEERGGKEMDFFCPAFKLRPNLFLNLARQFTILQMDFPGDETFGKKRLFPITLPQAEAIQALKVILASSSVTSKTIFPNLPKINFNVKGVNLLYIPFVEGLNEMIHEDTGMAINKPSLGFGRSM